MTRKKRLKKTSVRIVNGCEVNTAIKRFTLANTIEVECGTNGHHGGDTGHGSRTYIRITDLAGSDIRFVQDSERSLVMELGGDCELITIIRAMQYAANHLVYQAQKIEASGS
ncbi:MAG: hypothetical protein K6E84_10335 [Lachnospiraceae bacterium]|nr:hypothetical protein [Lachnospiraceae bacterium]